MDQAANETSINVEENEGDDNITKFRSKVWKESVWFENELLNYRAKYEYQSRIRSIVRGLTIISQLSSLLLSGGVAMWFEQNAKIVVPILGIIGTLLFIIEDTIKKSGLSQRIEKYQKLSRKAMKCHEEMLEFHRHSMMDEEISNNELMEVNRVSIELRHGLMKLEMAIDHEIDKKLESIESPDTKSVKAEKSEAVKPRAAPKKKYSTMY